MEHVGLAILAIQLLAVVVLLRWQRAMNRQLMKREELEYALDGLDALIYWQLSDPKYRRDGYAVEPFTDDPEVLEDVKAVQALAEKLEAMMPESSRE